MSEYIIRSKIVVTEDETKKSRIENVKYSNRHRLKYLKPNTAYSITIKNQTCFSELSAKSSFTTLSDTPINNINNEK